jgi:hypothetical protein
MTWTELSIKVVQRMDTGQRQPVRASMYHRQKCELNNYNAHFSVCLCGKFTFLILFCSFVYSGCGSNGRRPYPKPSRVLHCNTVTKGIYGVEGYRSAVDIVHGSRDEDMQTETDTRSRTIWRISIKQQFVGCGGLCTRLGIRG